MLVSSASPLPELVESDIFWVVDLSDSKSCELVYPYMNMLYKRSDKANLAERHQRACRQSGIQTLRPCPWSTSESRESSYRPSGR